MTSEEIKAEIIAAKNADSNLDGLDSPSSTSIWLSWVNVFTSVIKGILDLIDRKKIELQEAAANVIGGNDKWYAKKVLEWQYGYPLFDNEQGQLYYLVEDADARIVNKVAAKTVGKTLYIKVAKGDPLEPLTVAERTSLDDYIQEIKYAGTQHLLTSVDADLVKLDATVYYDGKLDLTEVQTAFELALNNYLLNIFFNGFFNINKFRDAGEAVEILGSKAIIDFQIASVEIQPDGGTYIPVTLNYNPQSGYFHIDPAYPLSTVITYVPV